MTRQTKSARQQPITSSNLTNLVQIRKNSPGRNKYGIQGIFIYEEVTAIYIKKACLV